jgi:hypothetical protein
MFSRTLLAEGFHSLPASPPLRNKLISLFKIYDGKFSHNSSLSLPPDGRVDSLSYVSERGETVELNYQL